MAKATSLGMKLALLVGTLALACAAIGSYGILLMRQMQAESRGSLELAVRLVDAVDSARAAEVSFRVQIQSFKNALLRADDQEEFGKYRKRFEERGQVVEQRFAELERLVTQLGLDVASVREAKRLHAEATRTYLEGLRDFDPAVPDAAQAIDQRVRGKDKPLEDRIAMLVGMVDAFGKREGERLARAAEETSRRAITLMLGVMGFAVVAAAALGTAITRNVLRQLGGEPAYASQVARRIAEGDLTVAIVTRGGDDASMLYSMKTMVNKLRDLLEEVARSAEAVAASSEQIASGNADLSRRTEEQAATLEETASQLEEIASTVAQNAEDASDADRLATAAAEVARRGGEDVRQVVGTMESISAASGRISEIIGMIDGIAFQTNILALNAAVEAARAGDQGRGFAVVAAEVRQLAQRSAAAATQIKGLVASSLRQTDSGVAVAGTAGSSVDEMLGSFQRVRELISQIALASREQSTGVDQVNAAVGQMEQVVQRDAAMVQEAAAGAAVLKRLSSSLMAAVGRFRLHAPDNVHAAQSWTAAALPPPRHSMQPSSPLGGSP